LFTGSLLHGDVLGGRRRPPPDRQQLSAHDHKKGADLDIEGATMALIPV